MPADDDLGLEELASADEGDELCRRLLASPWGWGSSTRHTEALDLLEKVHGTGSLGDAFLALLLCTCRRWDRVTTKLIAAIDDSGLLSGTALSGLAEAFLTDEVVVDYQLTWVSPEWLEVDLTDGTGQAVTIDESARGKDRRRLEPPLRRWAAARALRARPARLGELLETAEGLPPRHRDAMIQGLLDAADVLEPDERRRLVRRGLRSGHGGVRRGALERLCELDGPDAALRRARSDSPLPAKSRASPSGTRSPRSFTHAPTNWTVTG